MPSRSDTSGATSDGQVLKWRSAQTEKEFTAYLGMVLFLVSWAMLFAGLFLVYGLLRARAPVWPPPGAPALPRGWTSLNTLVLAASSVTMQLAVSSARRNLGVAVARWLGATLALGAAFLALQALLWRSVDRGGLHFASNLYGSVFYAMSGFHALHVASGVAVLAWLWWNARRGAYTAARHTAVRLGAMFWHFVDAVWIAMFLAIVVL